MTCLFVAWVRRPSVFVTQFSALPSNGVTMRCEGGGRSDLFGVVHDEWKSPAGVRSCQNPPGSHGSGPQAKIGLFIGCS